MCISLRVKYVFNQYLQKKQKPNPSKWSYFAWYLGFLWNGSTIVWKDPENSVYFDTHLSLPPSPKKYFKKEKKSNFSWNFRWVNPEKSNILQVWFFCIFIVKTHYLWNWSCMTANKIYISTMKTQLCLKEKKPFILKFYIYFVPFLRKTSSFFFF